MLHKVHKARDVADIAASEVEVDAAILGHNPGRQPGSRRAACKAPADCSMCCRVLHDVHEARNVAGTAVSENKVDATLGLTSAANRAAAERLAKGKLTALCAAGCA